MAKKEGKHKAPRAQYTSKKQRKNVDRKVVNFLRRQNRAGTLGAWRALMLAIDEEPRVTILH